MLKTVIILLVICLFSFLTISESKVIYILKCKGERVELGDTTYSVLKKCGEPAYKEELSAEECVKIEKWHYDCKGRGRIDELKFKEGILVDQTRGEESSGTQTCN